MAKRKRQFRFEILDRIGNLKEQEDFIEGGTIAHESKIQRGGSVLFDGNSDSVEAPIDFNKDAITICERVKLG